MSEHTPFFQRYQPADPAALAQSLAEDHALLEKALADKDEYVQLVLLSNMGARTTILGKEIEAVPLLEHALELAKQLGDQPLEVANLLNLATAQQYQGHRDLAQQLFQEALEKAYTYDQLYYEDFILHHRGRCYVEQGKIPEAIACFEQALLLRTKNGDPRAVASTQSALDALKIPD